jgi:hypothetical protein
VDTFEREGYVVEYDARATADAYARGQESGAGSCSCDSCDNFVLARSQAFPEQFLHLLSSMGIDWQREGEASEMGEDETGQYLYGGWFFFIGRVVQIGKEIEINEFRFPFCRADQLPRAGAAFDQGLVGAVTFITHLPWLSERQAPDEPSR